MPKETLLTNIPGLRGKADPSTGGTWKGYEDVTGMPETPPQGQRTQAFGPKPPEDYNAPDFSDRDKFEEFAFKQAGGKWFEFDPYDEVKKADEKLPDLFNFVFDGKVVWSDRDKLNKQEKDHWDSVIKTYHADTFNKAKALRENMKETHNFLMTTFDNSKKEYESKMNMGFKISGEQRAQRGETRTVTKETTAKTEGAYKRINDINTKMATLEKTDIITALLAAKVPELKDQIGQKLDPKLKKQLFDSFEREKRYWEQFLPAEEKATQGKSNLESFKSKWGL